MLVENEYLSQVPFPIEVKRPEYNRGEKLLVRPEELELDNPGAPYSLRRLALPEERAMGFYAVESLVSIEDVDRVGHFYTVTFSWEPEEKEPGQTNPVVETGAEPEGSRPERTVILSAATGHVLMKSMQRGVLKRTAQGGYFFDADEGSADTSGSAPERKSEPRVLAKV